MAVNELDLENLSSLAKLQISDAKQFTEDLQQIISFFDAIKTVNTTNIEPMTHPVKMSQRLRTDEITTTNQSADPVNTRDGFYWVPQVLD